MKSPCSTTSTCRPRCAKRYASVLPPSPLPMMTTSYSPCFHGAPMAQCTGCAVGAATQLRRSASALNSNWKCLTSSRVTGPRPRVPSGEVTIAR